MKKVGYYLAMYRGENKKYMYLQDRYVLVEHKLFRGYFVTPCIGYELHPLMVLQVKYKKYSDLIEDWNLKQLVDPDDVYLRG